MSIYIGNNKYKEIYLGSNKISEVYLGSNKIYESSVVPPVPQDEVTIGTQTWKTKNLAIDDGKYGIYTQTVNYGQGDVVEYYYTWDAANRVAATVDGWHLPFRTDWDTLAAAVGGSSIAGTKLKSTYGWESGNGTDDYGFSAFPAGYWDSSSFQGSRAYFWTEDTAAPRFIWCNVYTDTSNSQLTYSIRNSYACSVRLVKDA